MSSIFKSGDIVILKSGGPKMTVNTYYPYTGNVRCVWFNNNNEIQSSLFTEDEIKKVEEENEDAPCLHTHTHVENPTSGSICDDCGEEL